MVDHPQRRIFCAKLTLSHSPGNFHHFKSAMRLVWARFEMRCAHGLEAQGPGLQENLQMKATMAT
jgi:hypothetical protein